MTCTVCGIVNTADSRFCKHCGAPLRALQSTPTQGAVAVAVEPAFREKVAKIVAVLGGLNCGRCGYRTCAENAAAIARGESAPDSCVQGGAEAARQIREILGLSKRGRLWSLLWGQLTSIKLAITLIITILLISIVGTLIPQGKDSLFYAERYGMTGLRLIKFFQADKLYHSWYFLSLLALLGMNTLSCAIRRFRVSWELIRKPVEARSPEEIAKLPTHAKAAVPQNPSEGLQTLERLLARRRYRTQSTQSQLWAYKNLWGRLGVDLLHVSLIIVLLGGIVGGLLGFEDFQIAHKGEIFSTRGGFDVRVDDLWTVNYEGSSQIKDWYTKLTVIDNGREVFTQTIEVNKPLTYKGISFYQASFGTDWLSKAELTFRVERALAAGADSTTGASAAESLGEVTAQVGTDFPIDNLKVKVVAFYPDFVVTERGPSNRSQRLNNPAAYLEIYNGDKLEFSTWTFAQFPEFQHEFAKENPYKFYLIGMTAPEFTGLQIARNPGIGLIYTGFALMMLGLFLNFYLPPRRIWAAVKDNNLYLGGLGREPREFEPELDEITEEFKSEITSRAAGEPLASGAHN